MLKTIGCVVLAVALFACNKKDDKDAGGAAGTASGEFADVDCDKMIDHVTDIMVSELAKGKSDAEVAAVKQKMKDQRGTMVAACVKEKPTKKLTHKQYDCIMAAKSGTEMGGCK